MPKYSVIIPNNDRKEELSSTLISLIQNKYIKDYEIIVANDNSSEIISAYVKQLAEQGTPIFEVKIPFSQGSYYARNRAIKKASGDVFVFLDSGLEIPPNWFKEISDLLENYDYLAGNVNVKWRNNYSPGEKLDYLTAFQIEKTFRVNHFGVTAHLIVKKEVFEACGMFSEEIESGGDFEFGQRVYHSGFKQSFYQVAVLHDARDFKARYIKKKRVIKGHLDIMKHGLIHDRKYRFKNSFMYALFRDFYFLSSNFIFLKNNLYKSGIFKPGEFYFAVFNEFLIDVKAQIYARMNCQSS